MKSGAKSWGKLPASVLAVAMGSIPIGIALAERTEAPQRASESPAGDLAAQGEAVLRRVARARGQLQKAAEEARMRQELLLATCLEDKVEQASDLEGRAAKQRLVLQNVRSPEAGRVAYVVLTVIGQRASLVMEEAGQCLGSDPSVAAADWDTIEPPTDPNAALPSPPSSPVLDHVLPGVLPALPSVPVSSSPIR